MMNYRPKENIDKVKERGLFSKRNILLLCFPSGEAPQLRVGSGYWVLGR